MSDTDMTNRAAGDNPSRKREEDLERKLAEMRQIEEESKYKILAQSLNLTYSDLKLTTIDTDALSVLNEEESRSANMAVIFKKDSRIVVVTLDPNNPAAQKVLSRLKTNHEVTIILTNPRALEKVLNRYQTVKKAEAVELGAIKLQEEELSRLENEIKNESDIKDQVKKMSATGLLEIIMAGALKTEASDIHFEPETEQVRLRYRLDGLLHDMAFLSESSYERVLNRIKVLSKMKLNIHNTPQD